LSLAAKKDKEKQIVVSGDQMLYNHDHRLRACDTQSLQFASKL